MQDDENLGFSVFFACFSTFFSIFVARLAPPQGPDGDSQPRSPLRALQQAGGARGAARGLLSARLAHHDLLLLWSLGEVWSLWGRGFDQRFLGFYYWFSRVF